MHDPTAQAHVLDDPLIGAFTDFVLVVDSRLAALAQGAHGVATGHALTMDVSLPEPLVMGACADLVDEVRRVGAALARQSRNMPAETVSEFTYVLAAWADESLAQQFGDLLPAAVRGAVERKLFATMDAGEQLFVHMQRVIQRRSHLDVRLASLYLVVLALGFRGQYARESSEELVRLQRDLRLITWQGRPAASDGGQGIQYAPSSPQRRDSTVPVGLAWTGCVVALVLSVVVVDAAWVSAFEPVHKALQELAVHTGLEPAASPPRGGRDD